MTEHTDFKNRKLYRSQANRMIGGVCGGMAEYFGIDANLMRLLWVVLVFLGGSGIIIYLASLIIIPNNPDQKAPENKESMIKDKHLFWGSLLIVVGGVLLLKQLGLFYSFRFWHIPWQSIWAIVLIIAGGALLFNKSKSEQESAGDDDFKEKKLYRSRSEKMIGGVCGGLAEYFEFDVSVIRILWVIGTLLSAGIGVLVYLIMLIVFSEEPYHTDEKIQ